MARARSALKKRFEGLEQRLPAPRIEKPQPMHPEYAAHLFAATACTMPYGNFDDPTPGHRCTDPSERAACVAFWSGCHVNPVGEKSGPATDQGTAQRMANLAWELLPEVAESHQPLSEHREWYLATQHGHAARDEEWIRRSWLRYHGMHGLRAALAEAIIAVLEGRTVADHRLEELARLVMKVVRPIRLDGYTTFTERVGVRNAVGDDRFRQTETRRGACDRVP